MMRIVPCLACALFAAALVPDGDAAAQEPFRPAEYMTDEQLRAALDSIQVPECPPSESIDTAQLVWVEDAEAGAAWRMNRAMRPFMDGDLGPGRQREWAVSPELGRSIFLVTGPTRTMARLSWPLSVLLDQYQRDGSPVRRCYDCVQPITLCRTAVSGRRAWIATGQQEGWGSWYVDSVIVEAEPDSWIALSARSPDRHDPGRWAVVRSLRIHPWH